MTDRTLALLEEVADFLDGYVDVKDGSDGVPQPNEAMLLKGDVDGEIARIKRSAGPASGDSEAVLTGMAQFALAVEAITLLRKIDSAGVLYRHGPLDLDADVAGFLNRLNNTTDIHAIPGFLRRGDD